MELVMQRNGASVDSPSPVCCQGRVSSGSVVKHRGILGVNLSGGRRLSMSVSSHSFQNGKRWDIWESHSFKLPPAAWDPGVFGKSRGLGRDRVLGPGSVRKEKGLSPGPLQL